MKGRTARRLRLMRYERWLARHYLNDHALWPMCVTRWMTRPRKRRKR